MQHVFYRHYSVSFQEKGMIVQCCPTWQYFIIYILLSGLPLMYWSKLLLLLLSIQLIVNGFIYLKIQRAIPPDFAMLYTDFAFWKNYDFET